ncbi:MAG TPA: response regulator [Polyangiaceae bacterium]
MAGSFVMCADCGDASAAVEWGFVLLARHGWTAQLEGAGSEPQWRCPACNARRAQADTWDLDLEHQRSPQRRLRVLLVDDQVLVLRATAGMLRELDVVTTSSAAEALERLEQGSHFDVVASDVSMPGMSGPELFVEVRRRFPYLAERFLLLSGDSYGASLLCSVVARRERIREMPDILDKPVPRDVLVRAIETLGRRLPSSGSFAIPDSERSRIAKTK